MASLGNVVFIDRHIMAVAFLISLTREIFPQPSSSPFLPLPCSVVCISQAVDCPHLRRQYMSNECFCCICIGFLEFNKPATGMCKFHIAIFFSPSCCLYCFLEWNAEHISFWVRFAILWGDWSIKQKNCAILAIKHSAGNNFSPLTGHVSFEIYSLVGHLINFTGH